MKFSESSLKGRTGNSLRPALKRKSFIFALLCSTCSGIAQGQVTGGQHAFEFLRLPNAPHVSALGGINVASPDQDISFALQNPSLMRPGLHNHLGVNYNNYYSGIHIMNLNYGYHAEKVNTSFLLGVQYLNYGSLTYTDDAGYEYDEFRANDFAVSLGGSRSYGEHWRYGATLKLASSMLRDQGATAFLGDVGVLYYDTAALWTIGAVAKNMGVTGKKYNPGNDAEPLPFDLQIGVTKRLRHVPLRLMMTLHHLYTWNIRYDNPADQRQTNIFGNDDTASAQKSYFADKLFRHFIFGGEFIIAKRIGVTVGYNHMRRSEMGLKERMALAGFSFGVGIYLDKLQVHYARSYYHVAGAYNEIGFNFALNKLMGIGRTGDRIRWNADYGDIFSSF
jgi:hypothetical protein